MEDIFKPSSLTIKQLFGNTDALYQIPRYQRPYKWLNEQLEQLWDDLIDAQENEPNYFLGSIITAKAEDSSTYLDIVDGQQRTTTLLILFCVIRDHYPNINAKLLDEDPLAVDDQIIATSIRFNDRFERLRLRTHSNHESDFHQLILSPGATKELTKPLKKDLRREEEPKYKFINTAHFFKEQLAGLSEEAVGEFINYLFNRVKIIRIDCQKVEFAIKLFQVLNDRGMDLSNSDLIKSYLMGKIHRLYSGDAELRRQKEDQFVDDWKACENLALDTNYTVNELFVIYEYYLLGDNPRRSLIEELTTLFENADPNETIADYKRFLTTYKKDIFDSQDPLLYGFWYLRWGVYWRSILMTALHTQYPDFRELARALRRYYYLNWMAGFTLTRIKQTSFNLIKSIKAKKAISEIKFDLEKSMTENEVLVRAGLRLISPTLYYESWLKPLLFLIEYEQEDQPKFHEIENRNIHVEHILPRAFETNPDWAEVHGNAEMEMRINAGANLTLLSGAKNIAASNLDFDKKIEAYSGTGFYKNVSDEKVTSFRITQKIVDDYNAGKFGKKWNLDAMIDRESWFYEQAKRLLQIDF